MGPVQAGSFVGALAYDGIDATSRCLSALHTGFFAALSAAVEWAADE